MNAIRVYSLLHDACQTLDAAEDHAIAAHVGFAMALLQQKYDIDETQMDQSASE